MSHESDETLSPSSESRPHGAPSTESLRALQTWADLKTLRYNELIHIMSRLSRRRIFSSSTFARLDEESEAEKAKDEPSRAEIDFWYAAFYTYFVEMKRDGTDDLLFFVRRSDQKKTESKDAKDGKDAKESKDAKDGKDAKESKESKDAKDLSAEERVFVRRNHATTIHTIPSRADEGVDWEESFLLNVICNCFEYTLSFAVCAKKTASISSPTTGMKSAVHSDSGECHGFLNRWRVLHCISKNVYATPSRQRMDKGKDEQHDLTYPEIYFCIDDFEHIFKDAVVRSKDEYVCVEISAKGGLIPEFTKETTVFQGAVGFNILQSELQANRSIFSSLSSIKSIFGSKEEAPVFFTINGPNLRGKAQMALLDVPQEIEAKTETPKFSGFRGLFAKSSEPPQEPQATHIKCSLISISLGWQDFVGDLMAKKQGSTIMSSVVSQVLRSPPTSRASDSPNTPPPPLDSSS